MMLLSSPLQAQAEHAMEARRLQEPTLLPASNRHRAGRMKAEFHLRRMYKEYSHGIFSQSGTPYLKLGACEERAWT
jgi:tRNA/tmRNA/rRNA uracil-C5-methylase (TrmA/RlmC/RlmD family)